jgi:hypothetical protein
VRSRTHLPMCASLLIKSVPKSTWRFKSSPIVILQGANLELTCQPIK